MSVTITREGPVALVTLDDGKANALRPATMKPLLDALDRLESTDIGALVLAGRPGLFSAGLDLKLLPTLSREEQLAAFDQFGRLLLRVWTFPVPTVAAVTGHAVAGGALLALTTDLRYGSDGSFRFAINEVVLGLPMPTFGVEVIRSVVPEWDQADILLHGRTLTHAEARERGLFVDLHSVERVVEAAMLRARKLSAVPRVAYATTKARLRKPLLDRALATIDAEVPTFIEAFARVMATRR